MKRLALVLFVCLSVQMSALSAPFVHLHADAGHDTDHRGGRAVHRHVEAHDTGAHWGEVDHSAVATHGPSVGDAGDRAPQFLGGVTAAPATTITTLAGPATVFDAWSSQSLTPPQPRTGSPVPALPDISPASLRGPPR